MATLQDMSAELARLRAENEALRAKQTRRSNGQPTVKVWPLGMTRLDKDGNTVECKGNIAVYGLGQFPVTLYASQWLRLLSVADEIKKAIEDNAEVLATKV